MKQPASTTTQNLLRLLRSVDERSVALGLAIHQSNPTPESNALLKAYQQLYNMLTHENLDVLEAEQLVILNNPVLDLTGYHLNTLSAEIRKLTQLQTLHLSGNPLSEDETQRSIITSWLPHCKIYWA